MKIRIKIMKITCEISIGELIDKISILKIKETKLTNDDLIKEVKNEKKELLSTLSALNLDREIIDPILKSLTKVNSLLWDIEDNLRNFEKQDKFDDEFVENARKVYKLNDERFSLKNTLNLEFDSNIKEVKSYEKILDLIVVKIKTTESYISKRKQPLNLLNTDKKLFENEFSREIPETFKVYKNITLEENKLLDMGQFL